MQTLIKKKKQKEKGKKQQGCTRMAITGPHICCTVCCRRVNAAQLVSSTTQGLLPPNYNNYVNLNLIQFLFFLSLVFTHSISRKTENVLFNVHKHKIRRGKKSPIAIGV